MRIHLFTLLVLLPFSALAATPARGDFCAGIDRQISGLGNIVMREEIVRYSRKRGKAQRLDEIYASVEMAGDRERVMVLSRNGKQFPASGKMAGTWSLGDFAAVLQVSRDALCDGSAQISAVPGSQPPLFLASFHITADAARWFVATGGQVRWLEFDGQMSISAATAEAVQVSWASAAPGHATGIREVRRTLRMAETDVGGQNYVLPQSAEYRVIHDDDRVEWNTTRFTAPSRYGALVSLTY